MKILAEFGSPEGNPKDEVLLRLEYDSETKSINVLLSTDAAFQRKVVRWLMTKHSYVKAILHKGRTDSKEAMEAKPVDHPDLFIHEVRWMKFQHGLGVWGRIIEPTP